MFGGFAGWSSEQSGLALVLESEALAIDADDGGVVQDAIEHRGGHHAVAAKASFQLRKLRFEARSVIRARSREPRSRCPLYRHGSDATIRR